MPLVEPLPLGADPEVAELAAFFNTTLGFPPNSVLTMQRRPEIARAFIALNRAVMANHGRLTSTRCCAVNAEYAEFCTTTGVGPDLPPGLQFVSSANRPFDPAFYGLGRCGVASRPCAFFFFS
ncbi:MAG: hypothetical protein ABL889_20175 [Terricaulis sp.]